MANIHPTAIVDRSARIGQTTTVGPYCVIGPEVVIGERCTLHNHVTIQALTTVGDDNMVYPFSVLGADPQDRKYAGERSTCAIGNRNLIREHVTVHRGTRNGGGVTRIGSDNLIMVAAHIAHDCILDDHIVVANQVMLAGHVRVEEGANIGGGAGVHHYATIGTCSFVGGLARIAKDVPPFMIVEGNPAEVRGHNHIAMKRRNYPDAHIDAIKEAYKRLFRTNGAAMTETIGALMDQFAHVPAVRKLCDALTSSALGVHGRALETARADDKRATVATVARGITAARES